MCQSFSERCVELFLVYLLGLLKADQSNLALLASKVGPISFQESKRFLESVIIALFLCVLCLALQCLLEKLFDSFGVLFDFTSEKSKG